MRWSDIPFSPSERTLRQFAGLWIVFFSLLALWHGVYRGSVVIGGSLAGLAWTVGPVGLLWPNALRPVFVGWMVLVFPIGWGVSKLILALLYYTLFTPLGLVFRLIGRDVLCLKRPAARASYWTAKAVVTDARSYYHPF